MSEEYIKSPLNYTGGKYKILSHIIPTFPSNMTNFVDLFAGGLNVGINVTADNIYANDQITYLVDLYQYFQNTPLDTLLERIEERIHQYDLNLTNAEGYRQLRADYNDVPNPLDLFILTCFSFNHQIRFNNKHGFNTPFGKARSSYNDSIKYNLIRFCNALQRKNIILSAGDFRDFDFSNLSTGDMVYCDPPYLITTGSYNDGKRGFKDWTAEEDLALVQILDALHARGILFALSNVFAHKRQINNGLMEWGRKYHVNYINKTYANCSYHFKDRNTKTIEVLITNYEWKEPKEE